MDLPVLDFAETMAGLPALPPDNGLDDAIRKALLARYDVVIVLDDDPTGTQTVYDVPVVTEHTEEAILKELKKRTFLFYILTNSRALTTDGATFLAGSLGINISSAAKKAGKRFLLIQRGDSTLRGHFPSEDAILQAMTGNTFAVQYIIPAFFEGGRFTINNIHYVREGQKLVPAAQTPFAKDATFGYKNSDLRKWVAEKDESPGDYKYVQSLSLEILREQNLPTLYKRIAGYHACERVVVNAANYQDLKKAAAAILGAPGKNPLYFRTSASFIKALLGQPDRPLLQLKAEAGKGGLIIVGSHVPKSTAQLNHLRENSNLSEYEVDVRALLSKEPSLASGDLAQKIATEYAAGKTCVLYTSREVITTKGADANLDIAATVSAYLEQVVAALPSAPSFLLTKGGITSSRIATEALGVKRAMALGQVQPGVPTWELGPESKFPGMPFIIFPGNVGGEDSLSRILQNTII